jgi:hypothetical protein
VWACHNAWNLLSVNTTLDNIGVTTVFNRPKPATDGRSSFRRANTFPFSTKIGPMKVLLCSLALVASAWAGDLETPAPTEALDQSQQAPASQTTPVVSDAKPADAPAPPPKLKGFVISGLADGYFTFNYNHPISGADQLQNFNLNYGQPELDLAMLTVDKSDQALGFHMEAGFGEAMRLIHATDPAAIDHPAFRYIKQMYVIAKPNHTHGAEFDFGEFVTSAGAEVLESSANWNYSHSLLFAWAIPYYHFGFRSSVPFTKELTVGFQVLNAWNTLWGNNTLDNIGVTLALTKTKYTYTFNYYEGPNHLGTTEGKRNLVDSTLLLTPNSKLNVYINADYVRDNRVGGGSDPWYGLAGAARYQVAKKFAVAVRAEFFDDATGFSTGTKQVLKEGTITGEYKYSDHIIGRLEFRRDESDVPFFDRGAQAARTKQMSTVNVGLMILLGPLK